MIFDVEELLQKYHVSREYGFLIECHKVIVPDLYQPWATLAENIKFYIDNGTIRDEVDGLPELPIDQLKTYEEQRLGHIYLCTILAAYLWCKGKDQAPKTVPRNLGVPFITLSQESGMPPVVCHPTCCCANWRLIDPDQGFFAENLELIAFNPLETPGNTWFFTLTAQIEKDFGEAIYNIVNVVGRAVKGFPYEHLLELSFASIVTGLRKGRTNLPRLPEKLDPYEFYHVLRPYLWGYNQGSIYESGLTFEGLEHLGPFKHNGASAAQSSPVPLIDAFLGVGHSGDDNKFLLSQLQFMPKEHAELIMWTKENTPINKETPGRSEAVEELRKFRSEHIKTVSLFILSQVGGSAGTGTGGTPFMKFLKTLRDDSQ